MSEPEGLSSMIVTLDRHPELHGVVKGIKVPLGAYGSNGIEDGRRDWIKNIEYNYGADSVIEFLLEYAEENTPFEEFYTGEIGIQTISESLDFAHTLDFTPVQTGFWRKFISRFETPVDIQSALNLDGEAVTVYSPETINLLGQELRLTEYSTVEYIENISLDFVTIPPSYVFSGSNNKAPFDLNIKTIEEIEEVFTFPEEATNIVHDKYRVVYGGTYRFIIDVFVADTVQYDTKVGNFASTLELSIYVNSGTPILATATLISGSGAYAGDTITRYQLDEVFDLSPLDNVYIKWEYLLGGPKSMGIVYNNVVYHDGTTELQTYSYHQVLADSVFPTTTSSAFLIHDVAASILDRITDSNKFYSELLGSPYTKARAYAESGDFWNNVNIKGLHLRGYTLEEKKFFESMKDFMDGAKLLNVGIGYESVSGVDVIRLEETDHFYDSSSMSVLLSGVQKISRQYGKEYYNSVQTGFQNGKTEDIFGIDDAQNQTRASIFKNIGSPLKLFTTWIAQGLTIEQARRTTKVKSADYKFDDNTFLIEVTRIGGSEFDPRIDEDFDSVTGLLNADTRYNKHHTPARMFLRWKKHLFGCLQSYVGTVWRFVSGEGNYDMTSEMTPGSAPDDFDGNVLSEGGDITVTTDYHYIPILFEIEHYLTKAEFDTIDANRNLAIGVSQTSEDHKEFFIETLQYEIMSGQIKITGYFKEPFNIQTVSNAGIIVQGGKIFDSTFDFSFE